MAARGKEEAAEAGAGMERWLLTYSDMITLLMVLFIVLFSISSVNISKFITLQQSLRAAFSGSILPGGGSILEGGSQSTTKHSPNNTMIPSIVPLVPTIPRPSDQGGTLTQAQAAALLHESHQASLETTDFVALRQRINAYAKEHGWANQVRAQIEQQGLVVTILTDKLLFDSGQDAIQTAGDPLLDEVATLIGIDPEQHPVVVEGYTDAIPIQNAQFPSNWWLSSARANVVLQYLLNRNVSAARLSSAGYGDQHPIASNATAQGRARNRRVEIVFERKYPTPNSGS